MMARMFRQIAVAALFLSAILVSGARADQFNLTGTWTLQSMSFVDEATGKATYDFGEHPKGYAIYTPGGYMSVLINAEGRQPIPAASQNATELRAKLMTTMTAHAGPYRYSDGKLINQVQVAHDPRMVGQELVRFIRVIDNNHYESTTPATDTGNGKRVKVVLIWQRAA